jgi:hypothetical protein
VLFDGERDTEHKEGEAPLRGMKPRDAGREGAQMKSVFAKPAELTKIAAYTCLFFKTFIVAFRRYCQKYHNDNVWDVIAARACAPLRSPI